MKHQPSKAARTLVTGAGGFLGSSLTERLLAQGYTDLALLYRQLPPLERQEDLRRRYPQARIAFLRGNVMSRDDMKAAAAGANLVIHVAAAMRGAPADMALNTVVGSKYLLEALEAPERIRVVLISSFAVYGTAALPRGAVLNEKTPLEPHPEWRDAYAFSKWRQERLFEEYREKLGYDLVTIRPGVIYGAGGGALSSRVGVSMFGIFLHLGGSNPLPLSYVDNCAEAIAVAAARPEASGQIYNVNDPPLRCNEYLKRFRREVKRMPKLWIPYPVTMAVSYAVEWYHKYSNGQLPAAFKPYETRTLWKGTRFDTSAIEALGWRPIVSMEQGLKIAFEYHRRRMTA